MIITTLLLVPLFFLAQIPQAESNDAGRLPLMKSLFKKAGISAEMINLDRADGFTRALSIEGPDAIPVIISTKDASVLISVDGYEEVLPLTEDGQYEITQDDDSNLQTVLCVFRAITNLITQNLRCEEDTENDTEDDTLCIITNVLTTIISIIRCVS